MAFDIPRGCVVPVEAVDIRLQPGPHPFAIANQAAADANWRSEVALKPALFDGEVVLLSDLAYRAGRLAGHCHITRFSTFMFWRANRELGSAEHAFAHAALVSSDNALVAIRMAEHTANAGRVYFAAGSFEPSDFRDGQVDLEGNMAREVREETGLDIADAPRDAQYHLFSERGGTVIFRRYRLAETAQDLCARIAAFVAAETEPEIEGAVIISGADTLPEGTMPHMAAIVRWHFSADGQAGAVLPPEG